MYISLVTEYIILHCSCFRPKMLFFLHVLYELHVIWMNNRGNFWWGWASFDCFPHLDNVNRIYSICETRGVSKIWLFDSKSLKINNSNHKRTQSVEKFARKRLKFTNYGKLSPNFKNSVFSQIWHISFIFGNVLYFIFLFLLTHSLI